jgi:Tfp pilus assembly protein PilE
MNMKNLKETISESFACERNYLAFQAQEFKKSQYWRYMTGGVAGMNEFRHNQKGIALITVIIIITVVSVIVSSLVNISVMSFQRKSMDYRSKDTFYATEAAMDEVTVGLQKYVADNLQYWTTPATFVANVKTQLGGSSTAAATKLRDMILASSTGTEFTNGDLQVTVGALSNGADGRSVKLENVNISYKVTSGENAGYYSEIETDIVLSVPKATSSIPVGSYATVAGSGMSITQSETGQKHKYNAGNVDISGSIHVGYAEEAEDVSAQPSKWKAMDIGQYAKVRFSGDMTDINGNLKVGDYAVVTFSGAQVNIYGNLILGNSSTVIIDKNCDFKCHGILNADGSAYTGVDAANNLLSQINYGTDSSPSYTGHVPYTYPYITSIFSVWKSKGSYDSLDSSYEYHTNFGTGVADEKALPCFQNADYAGCYNERSLYTMKNPIQKSIVLIGTPSNSATGYDKYEHAGQLNSSTYTSTYVAGKGASLAENASNQYDYSGYCYPLVDEGSGFHTWEYGKGGLGNVNKNGTGFTVNVDPARVPQKKVQSKYLTMSGSDYDVSSHYNQTAMQTKYGSTWYDAVIYDFMELEYADVYYGSNSFNDLGNVYKSNTNSTLTKNLRFMDNQVVNTSDTIVYVKYHGADDVCANDINCNCYNMLCFTDSTITFPVREVGIIQPFVTKSQMDLIDSGSADGLALKALYDEWGDRDSKAKNINGANYLYLTSENQGGKNVYVPYAEGSVGYYSTYGFDADDSLKIGDWFKGGVQSLYSKDSGNGGQQQINSKTFQPVMYENWHRV